MKLALMVLLLIGSIFAHSLVNLKTGSMGVEFDKMSTIKVTHVPYAKIKIGDVICFQPLVRQSVRPMPYNIGAQSWKRNETGKYVCHRVVAEYYWAAGYIDPMPQKRPGTIKVLLTQGDALPHPDNEWVDRWAYLGVVK